MQRRTVLVVEDNDDLRRVFADGLALSGFQVRQAADGIEALRLIDAAPPDALVLDLGLPHVTGHDVLFELKEHAHTREIPVLIVTGSNDVIEGVDPACVMRKPVAVADLVERIQRCMNVS